jgi:hypothetical protein
MLGEFEWPLAGMPKIRLTAVPAVDSCAINPAIHFLMRLWKTSAINSFFSLSPAEAVA